mgnify:CR=1 FL=1
MKTKYYQKERCYNCLGQPVFCEDCVNKGFTRGTDVTELIEYVKILDKRIVLNLITHNLIEVVEEE